MIQYEPIDSQTARLLFYRRSGLLAYGILDGRSDVEKETIKKVNASLGHQVSWSQFARAVTLKAQNSAGYRKPGTVRYYRVVETPDSFSER